MPSDPSTDQIFPMRLQKFLSRAGVASRRGSEDLMTAGRVCVNGVVVTELGSKVDPNVDTVTVDGQVASLGDGPVFMLLNKPVGYLTTMDDPQGRPTVRELMPKDVPGLFPVGRLDKNTSGALLLSTDGELAHKLMHPSFHVEKTYEAEVEGLLHDGSLARLRSGITLDDGPTKPALVEVLERSQTSTRVQIVISEGRKRQVRRMFGAVGNPVLALHRAAIGTLLVAGLPEGSVRELTGDEVNALRTASQTGGS